ncbi:dihydroorotate dehydrogenase electron transfer subunit [Roseomonas sp. CCTCC AB2023176]|uniref:iron-sulfur cluster-binding protein n=1 Tax=Roseomonas sp. CCTCC AB2023176 TaxID=3342640 RepID=UPI0035DEFBDA
MDLPTRPTSVVECDARVLDSAPVGRRYHRLVVAPEHPLPAVRPGQFFHLLCRDATGGPYLRRPMSVWRARGDGELGFLLHVTGRGTAALATLRPGDVLPIVGPLGEGFRLDPAWRRILILARGVGLATLAPLAEAAAAGGCAVDAVLSAKAAADLMAEEFVGTSRTEVFPVLDEDGTSDLPTVEALLRQRFAEARPDAVFTCGSNRLLLLLQRLSAEHGIPGQVALEQQMACGLGMCFCCVRPIRGEDGTLENLRVCTEGPVFDLAKAVSW